MLCLAAADRLRTPAPRTFAFMIGSPHILILPQPRQQFKIAKPAKIKKGRR